MLLTAARAGALVAVLVSAWSLNLRWGADAGVGVGPPMQWERHVVGAILLAGVALLAMIFAGRGERAALPARVVALLAAAGALAIALWLRREATRGFGGLVEGPGWSALAAGAALAALAAAAFQWARRPVDPGPGPGPGKSSRQRRR